MKRPVIGVTVDSGEKQGKYALNADYVLSVEKAGALPLAIPYGVSLDLIPRLADVLDGILFIGGDDLDPALYGQSWHPQAVKIEPARQTFELALLAEVERRQLPALGICLGCQLMNVYRGGTLHQFLPEVSREAPIEHRRLNRDRPGHVVHIELDSQIGQVIGRREIFANTYHKQAVNQVGQRLRIVAQAPDGVIEAIEDPTLPLFAGVQWHPERLLNEPEHLALFELLARKASSGK
ncbi:MAG TPA: gamma-glutamyl-gamma-aminobutyrate hydrolase family protein [Tepidisphaeraceae bacterium]|nr:gamma-glutamyl-gamma-aminobutyrate hydrolase family protein [Tepidisphaeraceae bacterium]